ncbi:MAG: F0F1 ATP synthase subunit gamma [Propionibacteriaceae bacterium]|nr:F0F1 ATP synthase subunit gamma [Propionibacteriaceae bacterium]
MPATLRQLRERRKSVSETMKITRAMELIAASRVARAQQRARQAVPYHQELVQAVADLAAHSDTKHPLTSEKPDALRAAVLVVSSDRGLAGAYNSNITRMAEGLLSRLKKEGKQVDLYTSGRKAEEYFTYRHVDIVQSWDGFSERPHYEHAKEIGETLIAQFLRPTHEGGVDELHLVFTRFRSLVSQQARIVRLLPLHLVKADAASDAESASVVAGVETAEQEASETRLAETAYSFEPNAETVLDTLLPLYIINQIRFALTEAAASELASRQQAMHSATDNAKQLIDSLTRDANQARQAVITQEINEIVGGAGALTAGQN